MNPPAFKNRWLITGTFTTRSELHLGNGGAGELHDRSRPADKEKDQSDASTVCVDRLGRAYLPGSGIKGPLRSLVSDANGNVLAAWRELLGSDKPDASDAVGGKLEFWDAFHESGGGSSTDQPDPGRLHRDTDRNRPWWNDTRKTCVAVSVSLDRRTKTAKENLLYHLEYVPAAETFRFEIGGENLEGEEIEKLLALLGSFNRSEATLGAQTSSGWGRIECEVESVKCLDRGGLETWKGNPSVGLDAVMTVPAGFEHPSAFLESCPTADQANLLTIQLSLATGSPWLIRDPRQRERSKEAKKNRVPEASKPTDAVPVHDESGNPFVPAKSLRGALRARAEMILRTLDFDIAPHPGDITPLTTKGRTTKDVTDQIASSPDLAAKLFGLSGWMAPLRVPRLTQKTAPDGHHQEFVAIDRFTGGAADGAKFDADLAGMTTLTGTLAIDLDRLRKVDPELASLGLLALVLRDLAEGDIPLGSGSAKGQGFCVADATVTHAGQTYSSLEEWFDSQFVAESLAAFRAAAPRVAPTLKDPAVV